MKWLVIGPLSKTHLTAWSIIRALNDLKEEVFTVESRIWNPDTTARLALNAIKFNHIDYVISVDTRPDIFDLIPNSNSYKKIFWSFEFDIKYKVRTELMASLSDYFFSMCPAIAQEIKDLSICKNSFFLPQAADHFLYKPLEPSIPQKDRKYDIVFIGSNKLGRPEILSSIKEFNINVFGEFWNKDYDFPVHKAVYAQDFNDLCANSKIVLNLALYRQFPTPEKTVSQRLFMILATKTFCLTEEFPKINHFFNFDDTGTCWKSNLKDMIKFFLDKPMLRSVIARKGYRRVLECHKYTDRMQEMMKILQS